MIRPHPRSTPADTRLPATTLFRSVEAAARPVVADHVPDLVRLAGLDRIADLVGAAPLAGRQDDARGPGRAFADAVHQQAVARKPAAQSDRKSTRLNSSH